MKKKIPRYFVLRIFLVGFLLYFLLIFPIYMVLVLKNVPTLFSGNEFFQSFNSSNDSIESQDTVVHDSVFHLPGEAPTCVIIDSIHSQMESHLIINHSADSLKLISDFSLNLESFSNAEEDDETDVDFIIAFLALLVALLFNIPFKIFLNRTRKGKEIPDKIYRFCLRFFQKSALINTGIFFLGFVLANILNLIELHHEYQDSVNLELDMDIKFCLVSTMSSILVTFFVYFWLRHRLHFQYMTYFYSPVELQKNVFTARQRKIKRKLLSTSAVTTVLPIITMLIYISLSFSSIGDLKIEKMTEDHINIIFGNYVDVLKKCGMDIHKTELSSDDISGMQYINSIDSILMIFGITMGVLISLLFVMFFVKMTTISIVRPVKDLLENIRKTGLGTFDNYSSVVTNDEIGELTEGYNDMTNKLSQYVGEISEMNRTLEQKVIDRTAQISKQKEEIEAQRDSIIEQKNEIETQRDEIEVQRNMALEQRDMIEEQNKEIFDSIQYASRIQSAILPPKEYMYSILPEHFALLLPRDIVSGDFYWVRQKRSSQGRNRLFIAAADCTGHGVPGAFMSMLSSTLLNEIITTQDIPDAAFILNRLRNQIISSLHQNEETIQSDDKVRDGLDIALCIFDPETLELQYSGANNPLYIITSEKTGRFDMVDHSSQDHKENLQPNVELTPNIILKNSVLFELKGDKMPIGLHYKIEQKPFSNHKIKLETGDQFYLSSDGFADQFGGKDEDSRANGGKKFKYQAFKELLLSIRDEKMQDQQKLLVSALGDWKGKLDQVDDILIIGVKV